MRNDIDKEMNSLVYQLSNVPDVKEACKKIEISSDFVVLIRDLDDNIIFVYPDMNTYNEIQDSSDFFFKQTEKFFAIDVNTGRQMYFIDIHSYTSNFGPITQRIILRMAVFEIVGVLVVLAILIIIVNNAILKPVNELNEKMSELNVRSVRSPFDPSNDEIRQLNIEFNDLISALNDEKEKQSRMIASVSHDIKTPLTSILGYTEQLKKDTIPSERRQKYIDTIYSKANSIKDMINGLDEYLSYNTMDISPQSVKTTSQLLNTVMSYYGDDLKKEDAEVIIENRCPGTKVVINDSGILRVFGNLINNSIKHQRSGIQLKVNIKCKNYGKKVLFGFSDNGVGVESDKIGKIFEPFYTTDESRSKAVSGLGLSICQEIIDELGGKIWATKSDSGGLTVYFTIIKSQ